MEKYDYRVQVFEDVKEYYISHREKYEGLTSAEAREALRDDCWTADDVTGNSCGSYTCNTWEAEENICHNLDLLPVALYEFGADYNDALERGAEFCDVTIRCYLLDEIVGEVIEGLHNEPEDEEDVTEYNN